MNTTGNMAAAAQEFYRQEAFDFLQQDLYMYDSSMPGILPTHSGKVISGYRLGTVAAQTTPLDEGVAPASLNVPSETFEATLAQYGAWSAQSDLLEITGRSDINQQLAMIWGYNGSLTLDTLTYLAYLSGAAPYYAGLSSQASFNANSFLTSRDLRRLNKLFNHNSVPRFQDGYRRFYGNPDVINDLTTDDLFASVSDLQRRDQGNKDKWLNVAGIYAGFKVFEAPIVSTADNIGDQQVDGVYQNIAVGGGALMTYSLGSMGRPKDPNTGYQLIINPSSNVNMTNPLMQVGSIGWKAPCAFMYVGDDGPRAYTVYATASDPS